MSDINLDLKILKQSRQNILNLVKTFSIDQLNKIPIGFNNNIVWNFGHIIVTQQILCYKLSGVDMCVDQNMVENYRKGSKPDSERPINRDEFENLVELLGQTTYNLEVDFKNGMFLSYNTYTTSYGMTLSSIEEAIRFNNVHEGLHYGSILNLKKLV